MTDCMEKLCANDKKLAPDSVYGTKIASFPYSILNSQTVEALHKFVQIDKAIAESIAKAVSRGT